MEGEASVKMYVLPAMVVMVAALQLAVCYDYSYLSGAFYNPCHDITRHRNWHLLDLRGDCGWPLRRPPSEKYPQVENGRESTPKEFPWVAYLETHTKSKGNVICGGSLINYRYVLTAAQCCGDSGYVTIGAHDLGDDPDCNNNRCTKIQVDRAIIHPQYDDKTLHNDICLLRLKDAITNTEDIWPVCLPMSCVMKKDSFWGQTLTVAGWGNTGCNELSIHTMQKTEVQVVNGSCGVQQYKSLFLPKEMMCVRGTVGLASGSPSMLKGAHRYFQIGIVSSGAGCDDVEDHNYYPGVNTRVSFYLPWILDSISE